MSQLGLTPPLCFQNSQIEIGTFLLGHCPKFSRFSILTPPLTLFLWSICEEQGSLVYIQYRSPYLPQTLKLVIVLTSWGWALPSSSQPRRNSWTGLQNRVDLPSPLTNQLRSFLTFFIHSFTTTHSVSWYNSLWRPPMSISSSSYNIWTFWTRIISTIINKKLGTVRRINT